MPGINLQYIHHTPPSKAALFRRIFFIAVSFISSCMGEVACEKVSAVFAELTSEAKKMPLLAIWSYVEDGIRTLKLT